MPTLLRQQMPADHQMSAARVLRYIISVTMGTVVYDIDYQLDHTALSKAGQTMTHINEQLGFAQKVMQPMESHWERCAQASLSRTHGTF